jgi:hypothetical protein
LFFLRRFLKHRFRPGKRCLPAQLPPHGNYTRRLLENLAPRCDN